MGSPMIKKEDLMIRKKILLHCFEILTSFWLFAAGVFGGLGLWLPFKDLHYTLFKVIDLYLFPWISLLILIGLSYFLFKEKKWVLPFSVLISLYFSLFGMDTLYLYATGSYMSASCMNKLSAFSMIMIAPSAVIAVLLWQLESWKKKKDTFVSGENRFTQYFTRLMPMLLISGWLVLIAGMICSYWVTYYLYVYSQQSVMYTGMVFALAGYFLIWFGCSWAMIYKQRWVVLLFLMISIFALIPGVLSFHMVIWLTFAWWEKLILLLFGVTTLIAYFLSFAGEWLWVMERRRNRNLKKKKASPLWAQIFVSVLFLLALIKILALPFTEYRDMAALKQDVAYYFTHA
jgi:hypothetical protein